MPGDAVPVYQFMRLAKKVGSKYRFQDFFQILQPHPGIVFSCENHQERVALHIYPDLIARHAFVAGTSAIFTAFTGTRIVVMTTPCGGNKPCKEQ